MPQPLGDRLLRRAFGEAPLEFVIDRKAPAVAAPTTRLTRRDQTGASTVPVSA